MNYCVTIISDDLVERGGMLASFNIIILDLTFVFRFVFFPHYFGFFGIYRLHSDVTHLEFK